MTKEEEMDQPEVDEVFKETSVCDVLQMGTNIINGLVDGKTFSTDVRLKMALISAPLTVALGFSPEEFEIFRATVVTAYELGRADAK